MVLLAQIYSQRIRYKATDSYFFTVALTEFCVLPGLFPPRRWKGKPFRDGGLWGGEGGCTAAARGKKRNILQSSDEQQPDLSLSFLAIYHIKLRRSWKIM